jgi:hypothetical protein
MLSCFLKNMRNLILNNWKAKLVCLVLATVVWYVLRTNIDTPHVDPGGETTWRLQPPAVWEQPSPTPQKSN